MLKQLEAWHKTKTGLAFFVTLELLLFIYLISRALDTGGTIYYILALVILFGSLQNCYRLIRETFTRKPKRAK